MRRALDPANIDISHAVWNEVFDTFTRVDGLLTSTESVNPNGNFVIPIAWVGATWSVSSHQVINTPNVGANIWKPDASVFTSGTYNWFALGSNTKSNVGNALQITCVDNTGGAFDGLAASGDLLSNLTVGKWYKFSALASMNLGQASLYAFDGVSDNMVARDITTVPAINSLVFKARSATNGWISFAALSIGEIVTIDDLLLKPLAISELIASVSTGSSDAAVSAKLTMIQGIPGGVVACLDSASNPQNFLIAYHNGSGAVELEKCVGGVYFRLIYAAATYRAGTEIAIVKVGTTVQLWYNGVQAGADVTVTDAGIIGNKLHGIFATDPTVVLDNFHVVYSGVYTVPINVYALGDSITEGGQWLSLVSDGIKNGWNNTVNLAYGGTSVMGVAAHNLWEQVDLTIGANIVFILMGTNDADDTDVMRTTYQAFLVELQATNPGADIYAMGILNRHNLNANAISVSAQIAIAAANVGVKYWDTQSWIDHDVDTTDGLHPNAGGYVKIANEILSRL